jgi:hypothetical protein
MVWNTVSLVYGIHSVVASIEEEFFEEASSDNLNEIEKENLCPSNAIYPNYVNHKRKK